MSKILVIKAFGRTKEGRLCSAFSKNPLSRTYELGRMAVAPDYLPFPIIDDFYESGTPAVRTSFQVVVACIVDSDDVKTSVIPCGNIANGSSVRVSYYQEISRSKLFDSEKVTMRAFSCVKKFVPLRVLIEEKVGEYSEDDDFSASIPKLVAYAKEIDFPIWGGYNGELTKHNL